MERLDVAVLRHAVRHQSRGKLLYVLVMEGIDIYLAFPADGIQRGSGCQADQLVALGAGLRLPVSLHVLVQCSAQCDVDCLDAPADAEDRLSGVIHCREHGKLEVVPFPVDLHAVGLLTFPVPCRIYVHAAGVQEAVTAIHVFLYSFPVCGIRQCDAECAALPECVQVACRYAEFSAFMGAENSDYWSVVSHCFFLVSFSCRIISRFGCRICLLYHRFLLYHCFSAPIPPSPFPGGEGGDFRLFYARGFAPCIPGAGRGAALGKGANHAPAEGVPLTGRGEGGIPVPGGGRAFFAACLPCLCFLFCPLSPYPLPRRGRGRPKLFYARGFAPCIPGAGRGAALGKGANHAPGGERAPYRAGLRGHPGAQRGACPVGCPLTLPLACFSAPIPPSPFPAGRGRF